MPKIKGAKRTLEVKIRLTETEWNELGVGTEFGPYRAVSTFV